MMDTTMALEVLGGPMDGLRTRLLDGSKATRIGRQVGNHLTLPFDMTISRWHATVKKEGKHHYITDEKSVSGIWIEGARQNKIKVKADMAMMMGGTMLELFEPPETAGNIAFKDTLFDNPLDMYKFSSALEAIWTSLRQKKPYGGITTLFQLPEFNRQKKLYTYKGVKQLCRSDPRCGISNWMKQCDIQPRYRFFPKGQYVTAPRMWRVLDIASKDNTTQINFLNLIEAILKEARSPAARILKKDTALVRHVKNKFGPSPKKQKATVTDQGALDPLKDILAGSFIHIETIISGFIEDALSKGLSQAPDSGSSPGLNLGDISSPTEQADLSARLKRLEKNLVAVLAAHRDALVLFEKELGKRITHVLDHEDQKNLFSGSNTTVSSKVKRVLKDAELEGLANSIVRQTVKNKIIS